MRPILRYVLVAAAGASVGSLATVLAVQGIDVSGGTGAKRMPAPMVRWLEEGSAATRVPEFELRWARLNAVEWSGDECYPPRELLALCGQRVRLSGVTELGMFDLDAPQPDFLLLDPMEHPAPRVRVRLARPATAEQLSGEFSVRGILSVADAVSRGSTTSMYYIDSASVERSD